MKDQEIKDLLWKIASKIFADAEKVNVCDEAQIAMRQVSIAIKDVLIEHRMSSITSREK